MKERAGAPTAGAEGLRTRTPRAMAACPQSLDLDARERSSPASKLLAGAAGRLRSVGSVDKNRCMAVTCARIGMLEGGSNAAGQGGKTAARPRQGLGSVRALGRGRRATSCYWHVWARGGGNRRRRGLFLGVVVSDGSDLGAVKPGTRGRVLWREVGVCSGSRLGRRECGSRLDRRRRTTRGRDVTPPLRKPFRGLASEMPLGPEEPRDEA